MTLYLHYQPCLIINKDNKSPQYCHRRKWEFSNFHTPLNELSKNKLLALGNKNKSTFILHSPHLFVTLQAVRKNMDIPKSIYGTIKQA